MFDSKSLRTLEYPKILEELASHCQSSASRELARSLVPFESVKAAEHALDETSEADRVLFEYVLAPEFAVDDLKDILVKSEKGAVLSIGEILKVGRSLRCSRRLISVIEKAKDCPNLYEMATRLYANQSLEDRIFKSFISDTEVADDASAELKLIRQRIRKINQNIKTTLQQYINSSQHQKHLQDSIVTVRGDRYVIPVKSEFKGAIQGIVHDQSSSGSTLYIEPIQVVNLNNDLRIEMANEQAEIEKILREFSSAVTGSAKGLEWSYQTILDLDLIFAKAQLAKDYKAIRPNLNEKGHIKISAGRHPLIDKKTVVPVSLELGASDRMLLITGPNTGGKTVTLKLVGLFTVLALSGMFIPAKSAELSIFDGVYSDIGDEQSIEQSLSTFSSHIKNTISILDRITDKSLVLFDELGSGTDPSEGSSLAVAIAEYLLSTGCRSFITSHFNDLKEFALVTPDVVTASMEFDINTLSPTFRLVMGAIGCSNALSIAKKLGLKSEIIESAESKISKEKKQFDSVLNAAEAKRQKAEILVGDAEKDRLQAASELRDIEKEKMLIQEKREKLDESIRKETKKLISKSVEQAEDILDQLKDILSRPEVSDADLFEARKLKKQLETMEAAYDKETVIAEKEDPTPLKIGDKVFIKSVAKKGILKSLKPNGEAQIQIGSITTRIKKGDYYKVK